MNILNGLSRLILLVSLLFLVMTSATNAKAEVVNRYVAGTTANQLAWWGPRYYRPYYRPVYYGPRCKRTCVYNTWGKPVNCFTRCVY
ncbi:Uncharacterised protein (plasmid) [Legionella adelaidensis]|uniref:Uncharacterized protein n=1 Tax=Legionella adelaidensis TaxID=45056 RepID=A0A0W0R263_9GAMM|nr:hypothetical protein [Legionella adelaidensis]KTC65154.1 hypothetical protein Lade_1527 [Legionella adelaidensis]VEH85046.1 Uncharacterised protein [Legionella adelaidensis]